MNSLVDILAYNRLMKKFNSLSFKEKMVVSQYIAEERKKAYDKGYQQAKKDLAKKRKTKRDSYDDEDSDSDSDD